MQLWEMTMASWVFWAMYRPAYSEEDTLSQERPPEAGVLSPQGVFPEGFRPWSPKWGALGTKQHFEGQRRKRLRRAALSHKKQRSRRLGEPLAGSRGLRREPG